MIIRYYAQIASLTGREYENWPAAATVSELLTSLSDHYGPELGRKLINPQNGCLEEVFILLNGKHLRYCQGLATKLEETDEICVIPLIDGG